MDQALVRWWECKTWSTAAFSARGPSSPLRGSTCFLLGHTLISPPALLCVSHATGAPTEDTRKTPKTSILTVTGNRANDDLYNIIMMVIYKRK